MSTKITSKIEIWKKVKFNYDFDLKNEIHVSNFGNIRSFNRQNDGKLLKGSMIEGYKILKLRFFRERDPLVEKKIKSLFKKIKTLKDDIRISSKELLLLKRNNPKKKELAAHISNQQLELEKQKLKYEVLNKEENLKRKEETSILVHRLVADYFLKKPTKIQKFVIHLDHDKLNNHVDNLSWATMEEVAENWKTSPKVVSARFNRNVNRKGLYTKLNEKQVIAIKKKLQKGKTLREIATEYGVSDMQIFRIKSGENWGHVVV